MSDSQSKAARLRTLTAQPPIVEKWTRNQNVCTLPFALRWSSLGLEHLKKRKEMGSNQFVDDSKRKERKLEIVSIRRFMFLVAVNIGSDSASVTVTMCNFRIPQRGQNVPEYSIKLGTTHTNRFVHDFYGHSIVPIMAMTSFSIEAQRRRLR